MSSNKALDIREKRLPKRLRSAFAAVLGILCFTLASAGPREEEIGLQTLSDHPDDSVARRSDPGADGAIDPLGLDRIELLRIHLGLWAPADPQADLFTGTWTDARLFYRIQIDLAGLVNPPGPVRPQEFDPCRFGDRPVYGFVEIDVDNQVATGGELDAPGYRFLGNAARFGGLPFGQVFQNRVALDGSAFDGEFESAPYVERHGEEFHLALLHDEIEEYQIEHVTGNSNNRFESGETWRLEGRFFHRAHGFEPFSLAYGGEVDGEYEPDGVLEFRHDPIPDVTHVSWVHFLTHAAAAMAMGGPAEPIDHDASNHTSILEALQDLRESAAVIEMFPTGQPEEAVILNWQSRNPGDFLDPSLWRATALLGTAYQSPQPEGEFFVWTDIYPNVIRGDVNASGQADADDRLAIENFTDTYDAQDGAVDGRVTIDDFGLNFHVFDVNHDGIIDAIDALLTGRPGDANDDATVDLADYAAFQACFSGPGASLPVAECALLDLDADADLDLIDARRWLVLLAGPIP